MAEFDLLETFDGFAPLRNALRDIANVRSDWAGLPMPLDGQSLVIEPGFPNAEKIMEIGQTEPAPPPDFKIRNIFWSFRWRCDIAVCEDADGKIRSAKIPGVHSLGHQLSTLGASVAWGIEQEGRAVQFLGRLLKHHPFKQYLLTGMFLETSPRSGVTYLFRKLRPTVAITFKGGKFHHLGKGRDEEGRILCALCLHPIAYYDDSWAGAMCPTDDVIAHLMLMRGDEPMFWRRANQHAPHRPEAGL